MDERKFPETTVLLVSRTVHFVIGRQSEIAAVRSDQFTNTKTVRVQNEFIDDRPGVIFSFFIAIFWNVTL